MLFSIHSRTFSRTSSPESASDREYENHCGSTPEDRGTFECNASEYESSICGV